MDSVNPNVRRAFGTLVSAAFADGTLSDHERQVLHRKATEMNVPSSVMHEIVEQGRQGKLSVAIPPGARERERLLEDLIDIVCADGRLEAPEHHLIAKFASHLGLALPDLRAKVRDRMEKRQAPQAAPPRPEPVRPQVSLPPPPPPAVSVPPVPPSPPPVAPPVQAAGLSHIPPITLQLIRQAILFTAPQEAVRYIERILNVSRPDAERTFRAVCAAYPDMKPGSHQASAK
jgi:uncharacterized tellurite resistance protein B-like protein